MTPPPVHALLLNWNGWRDTIECLESVFASDYPDLRVIVCDNASTDGSLDRIREWAAGGREVEVVQDFRLKPQPPRRPIPVVDYGRDEAERGGRDERDARLVLIDTGTNLGYAGGNNVGLRYLLARKVPGYVWVLNNDTVVAPDALALLVAEAERDPLVAAVGGTLLEYTRPDRVETVGGGRVRRWTGFPGPTIRTGVPYGSPEAAAPRIDFITGGCALVRLRHLERTGLIDERYFLYCEDADWSFRMLEAGYRIACEPRARVWHKGGGTVGHRSPRHDYYIVKSALLLVHRFNPRHLPLAFLFSVVRTLAPKVVRGQRARAIAVLKGYRDFFRQIRTGASRAVLLQQSRRG